jgi:hypothetical protein
MRSGWLLTVGALTVVLGAVPGSADEPLITDRPDFTESAFAVGRGTLQLEAGTTYADFGSTTATTLGELLVRYGIGRKLELRLATLTYLWLDEPAGNDSGFIDSAIGAKWELHDGQGGGFLGRTAAALIVASTFPSGNSEFRSTAWQPAAVLALSWDLSSSMSLGSNLGYGRPAGDDGRFNSVWASAALGVGVTDATSVFFELYGFDREEARGPNTVTFQTGVTHLLGPDLQLDARVARRLTEDGPDFLIAFGGSWRYRGRK